MAAAVMTTKGQVTIPQEVRKEMGLKKGDRIEFRKNPATGTFELRRKTGSVKSLIGMLKSDRRAPTLEEIDLAIGDQIVDEYLLSVKSE